MEVHMRWIFMMAVGLLMQTESLASPTLDLPEVSGPGVPFVHYGGTLAPENSTVLTTVPDNKELIITLVMTQNLGVTLMSDAAVIIPGWVAKYSHGFHAFQMGTARVPIPAGEPVSIHNSTTFEAPYYVQGYLTEPSSPYRYFYSLPEDGETQIVMTAEDDRPFLVQTIICNEACNVLVNGEIAIPVIDGATYRGSSRSGLTQGRATLLVPAGGTLKVSPPREHFVNGKYITP